MSEKSAASDASRHTSSGVTNPPLTATPTSSITSLVSHANETSTSACTAFSSAIATVSAGWACHTSWKVRGRPESPLRLRMKLDIALRLEGVEARVVAARRRQRLVRAALDDPAAIEDDDLVGHAHGGEAVGDE